MKMVIISPYSQRLRNGNRNPKNFPYWTQVALALRGQGVRVEQIGQIGEDPIGADAFHINLGLRKIEEMVHQADSWAAVDNFFPHLCNVVGKPGVVVWGKSDPTIFGYPQNTNLLKSRTCLRPAQFDIWDSEPFDEKVFVSAEEVTAAILKTLKD